MVTRLAARSPLDVVSAEIIRLKAERSTLPAGHHPRKDEIAAQLRKARAVASRLRRERAL